MEKQKSESFQKQLEKVKSLPFLTNKTYELRSKSSMMNNVEMSPEQIEELKRKQERADFIKEKH